MLDLEQVARVLEDAVAPVTADEARARAGARTHFRRTAMLVTVSAVVIGAGAIIAVVVALGLGRHSTVTVVGGNATTTTGPPAAIATPTTPTTVRLGYPIGKIVISKIGVDWVVVQGSRPVDERDGPIHDPESPMPGENGNVVIAGHRTTYGAPFYRLDELKRGDVIQITTLRGGFTYIVDDSFIVPPRGGNALFPENVLESAGCGHGPRSLTLITNAPKYSVDERLVVTARMGTEPVRSCAR
jgi:LPXTG-site transpeptidase (sortase) family protein